MRVLEIGSGSSQVAAFSDESFDSVFAIGSFFMIDEREKALKEMIRVTRKGGHIGIAEPMCTTNPIPSELEKHEIFTSYNKWLQSLHYNSNLFRNNSLTVTEEYYFPEAYHWAIDNFNIMMVKRTLY